LVLAGAFLPVQGAVNAQLAQGLGHPLSAAVFSAIVTTVGLLINLAIVRPPIPAMARLAEIPWWMFLAGGVAGSYALFMFVVGAPILGAGVLIAALLAGQLVAGVALNHYGALGLPQHSFGPGRAIGLALLAAGVIYGAQVLAFCRSRQRPQTNLRRDCSDLKGPCLRGRAG
jgi:transporter family-2 protein